jgi:ankyrin repeat protein
MDVNSPGYNGWSALHAAAFKGHVQVVQILLEHNADINAQNNRGEVPLHLAACPNSRDGLIPMMQLLLDHGADVNARDNEGSTPLHHSSHTGDESRWRKAGTVEGTRFLLEHGASIDAVNNMGETPRQRALVEGGSNEIAEFLLEYGTK